MTARSAKLCSRINNKPLAATGKSRLIEFDRQDHSKLGRLGRGLVTLDFDMDAKFAANIRE